MSNDFELAIEAFERVGTDARAERISMVRKMRTIPKHQSWKKSVRTGKPWGDQVGKRDRVWTQ